MLWMEWPLPSNVALKWVLSLGRRGRADGIPAAAAVVVVVVRVARAAGVRRTIAVGVEVQVLRELVAGAGGGAGDGRAAHAGACAGERAAGAAVVGGVAGRHRAVAVQIPAHRVQLRERCDLDEAVLVHVVVRAGAFGVRHRHAQARRRAAVAAAGRRVGDQHGLVQRIACLGHRGRGDRLRGVPVLRGERQRGPVHRHRAGVVAGHRHGRVRARLRGEAHRVGSAVALGQQQGAGVQRRGRRVRVDQHGAELVVVYRHRHARARTQRQAGVAATACGVGERHLLVAGVAVVGRGHRHRLGGGPVHGRERQGVFWSPVVVDVSTVTAPLAPETVTVTFALGWVLRRMV